MHCAFARMRSFALGGCERAKAWASDRVHDARHNHQVSFYLAFARGIATREKDMTTEAREGEETEGL